MSFHKPHPDTMRLIGKLYFLFALLLFTANYACPQDANRPFSKLDAQVRSQQGGWNGDKSKLSTVFAEERRQLGPDFEEALLRYLDKDPEKHYWISAFLEDSSYLHGEKPLPYLSLLVMQQGLDLLRDKTDDESVGLSLSLNVISAVLARKLGLTSSATLHKTEVERRLSQNSDWGAYFPAMTKEDRTIYDTLPPVIKRVNSVLDDPERPETRVIGGVLNDKALKLPAPAYANVEASGEVTVAIVFDEEGRVIWARAIRGPQALYKAAEAAARNATFRPFKLEGKPEKVSGVLIYRFVR